MVRIQSAKLYESQKGQDSADNSISVVLANNVTPVVSVSNTTLAVTSSTFSTTAKQDEGNTSLSSIDGKVGASNTALSSLDSKVTTSNTSLSSIDGKASTANTSLASILAKIIISPATEALQTAANTLFSSIDGKASTANTSLSSLDSKATTANTSLASILTKLPSTPSTEAKQDAGNTTLSSILTKLIIAPATEALQTAANVLLTAISNKLPTLGQQTKTNSISVITASNSLEFLRRTAIKTQYKPGTISASVNAIPATSVGQTILISKIILQSATTTASTVNFQTATSSEIVFTIECPTLGTGLSEKYEAFNEISLGDGKGLWINLSSAVAHRVYLEYYIINTSTREPV